MLKSFGYGFYFNLKSYVAFVLHVQYVSYLHSLISGLGIFQVSVTVQVGEGRLQILPHLHSFKTLILHCKLNYKT